jgi:hypothetical protein
MNLLKNFCFIFCLVICNTSYSQKDSTYKKVNFKIAPLALWDFDNTLLLSLEHRLKNEWTMVEEFGYGRDSWNPWLFDQNNIPNKTKIKARVEFRKYKVESPVFLGKYTAYDAYFKQVSGVFERTIGYGCENGNCQYFEKTDFPISKYVFGMNVKRGRQVMLGGGKKRNSNFTFDSFIGIGFRAIINVAKKEITQNSFGNNRREFNGFNNGLSFYDESYIFPNITLGLRIGFTAF